MNLIGKYDEKPGAYHIGKAHEKWAISTINNHSSTDFVKMCVKQLSQNLNCLEVKAHNPESHVEKSDLFLSLRLKKENGINKIVREGVSAKSGTTTFAGQVYRGSIQTVMNIGWSPVNGLLAEQHIDWLESNKGFLEIENFNQKDWIDWYKGRWEEICESSFFGNTTFTSNLLLSNLNYDEKNNELKVVESAFITKKQALEDFKQLSNKEDLKINMEYSSIGSGIIYIKRAGGSNGGKGAKDWQVRLDRSKYIKWIKENRSDSVFVF